MDFDALFASFRQVKVGVIGDVMLDTYWWGEVERISPEAPVPVVALQRNEHRIGGAGNVALNLVAMGAPVTVFSVLGQDANGEELSRLLRESGVDTSYLVFSDERKTTSKTRIISRNQQMMRLDSETIRDITAALEDALYEKLRSYIENEKPAVLIFEDYNKGVLTENLIGKLVRLCRENGVITTVDPKKKNFFAYSGVDIFKPNLKEVREGLNIPLDKVNLEEMERVHTLLEARMRHQVSFITLSEKGVFYQSGNASGIIPSHLRNIADVSGAGDTVIAIASLVYAATGNLSLFAEIANIAGGLVCEEVGTAAIRPERLLAECRELLGKR